MRSFRRSILRTASAVADEKMFFIFVKSFIALVNFKIGRSLPYSKNRSRPQIHGVSL